MKLILGVLLFPGLVIANSGTDLLLKDSKVNLTAPIIQVQKQIKLDDPFLIQFYGVWKASRIYDQDFTQWVDLLLDKKLDEALKVSYSIKIDSKAKEEMVNATRLYLLWNLKLNQTYFNEWLSLTADRKFFNSQFAHSIDQMTGPNASDWFVNNGIYLTSVQKEKLDTIATLNSLYNNSAQANFNLRSGVKGMDLIKRLPVNDKLRLRLGDSLILGYARKNELAKSAKLLKEIYEPVLANETDIEKLSSYYLLLARLLYQAKAYDASEHYYSLIPADSKKFLTAKVEKLWITMRNADLATIKGDVNTLSMSLFEDQFLPEVHLVSAMANLKLCQFKEVEDNFKNYIRVQTKYAKEIAENLQSKDPKVIDPDDYYLKSLVNVSLKLTAEKQALINLKNDSFKSQIAQLDSILEKAQIDKSKEIRRKWNNREKLLEGSIRKMRFVKVEFLSMMRRLKSSLAQVRPSDSVNMKSSGIEKSNKLVFPYDGVLFGDELFHYQSDLKNLCLRGRQ